MGKESLVDLMRRLVKLLTYEKLELPEFCPINIAQVVLKLVNLDRILIISSGSLIRVDISPDIW